MQSDNERKKGFVLSEHNEAALKRNRHVVYSSDAFTAAMRYGAAMSTTRAAAPIEFAGRPRRPARLPTTDAVLIALDQALRTLSGAAHSGRAYPGNDATLTDRATNKPIDAIDTAASRAAGALMRVNHVGEVCAQALYSAQAMVTQSARLRHQFQHAAREETDHLAWTQQRLRELGDRPSLLNPLWYAGAFGLGLLAGRAGDAISLGFVVETERQVESHLDSHLARLPPDDAVSRAIVTQMKDDEARHGAAAQAAGASPLPAPVRWAMRLAGRVMTTTAHYL